MNEYNDEYNFDNDGSQRALGCLACVVCGVFMSWAIYELIRVLVDQL